MRTVVLGLYRCQRLLETCQTRYIRCLFQLASDLSCQREVWTHDVRRVQRRDVNNFKYNFYRLDLIKMCGMYHIHLSDLYSEYDNGYYSFEEMINLEFVGHIAFVIKATLPLVISGVSISDFQLFLSALNGI